MQTSQYNSQFGRYSCIYSFPAVLISLVGISWDIGTRDRHVDYMYIL